MEASTDVTHRGLLFGAALSGILVCGPSAAAPTAGGALTEAGTAIENRATLIYVDASSGETIEVGSNVAQVSVAALRRFTFEAPGSATLAPGARADFPHVLHNVGNAVDDYAFGIVGAPVAGVLPEGARLVLDADGDGIADPDERVLASADEASAFEPLRLAPGERAELVLTATVPASAFPGARFAATLLALADPTLPGLVPAPRTLMDVIVTADADEGGGRPDPVPPPDGGAGTPLEPALRFTGPAPVFAREGLPPRHAVDADHVDREVYELDVDATTGRPAATLPHEVLRDGVYLEYVGAVDAGAVLTGPGGTRHLVATVASAASGAELRVLLRESAPGSETYRSIAPFSLRAAGGGTECPADFVAGTAHDVVPMSAADGCALGSGPGDTLVASIANGLADERPTDVAVTDRPGTVFDAATGRPVKGVRVTVMDGIATATHPVSGAPLVYVTDGAGRFTLPRLPAGDYSLAVEPPDEWRFPSVLPAGDFPDRAVFDASYGSAPFTVAGGDPAPVLDVPLDPLTARPSLLVLDKRVDATHVEIGDPVRYRISVENRGEDAFEGVTVIDSPPAGFRYVPGTARIDGLAMADPVPSESGTGMQFSVGALAPGAHAEIAYRLQAGAGAGRGDGLNLAIAGAVGSNGETYASDVSRARVALDPRGRFSERGLLFGKVWIDATCDGLQNDAEWPLPGVRLYLEDGRFVVTDEHGQYSLENVDSGLHALKLDATTLPAGLDLVPLDTRHAADPSSRFVRVSRGAAPRRLRHHVSDRKRGRAVPRAGAARRHAGTTGPSTSRAPGIPMRAARRVPARRATTATCRAAGTTYRAPRGARWLGHRARSDAWARRVR